MVARRALLLSRLLPPGLLAAPSQLPLLSCSAVELSLDESMPTASSSTSGGTGSDGGSSRYSSSWGGCGLQPPPRSTSFSFAPSLAGWRGYSSAAATAAAGGTDPSSPPAMDELPLWRFLQQQGFSAAGISRIHRSATIKAAKDGHWCSIISTTAVTAEKVQRDVAPKLAALRAEGLDTASMEQLFVQFPHLLTTRHATFSAALAALQLLVALLPDDPHAVQAPAGSTQLGVALWLYPAAAAQLLTRANLGSLIDGNLRLRRQLGVSDAALAAAIFKNSRALVSKFERAEAMAAHLQRLRASGALSQEEVAKVALLAGALHLTPAEFDRFWRKGGLEGVRSIAYKDPAGRQRAAAEALGELLQSADGVPGPLQPQFRQQCEALVQSKLWRAGPAALRASWASLQQLGLSNSQLVAVVRMQPAVLGLNWEGEAKQRLLAWVQQELGLSPSDFLLQHNGYTTHSVATIAMRADYLRQHRPAVWEEDLARGTGPLLSTLTQTSRFLAHAGCPAAELAAFNRAWLATPAGRRWGGKVRRVQREA